MSDTIQLKKVGEPIQKQSLAEQIMEIKNKKEIDRGKCIELKGVALSMRL